MRGHNFLPATASPADSARSILICRGKLELINISVLLFCATGIISTGQMHLYLALLFHRDYFHRPDASLSRSFAPQGLFRTGRMHLYPALLLHRDYSAPVRCISIGLFCSTGIISAGQLHLYRALLFHRDYFAPAGCISIWLFCFTGIILPRPDASLSGSFAPQGLFRPSQIRPPSLKTSLPVHSVNCRFLN